MKNWHALVLAFLFSLLLATLASIVNDLDSLTVILNAAAVTVFLFTTMVTAVLLADGKLLDKLKLQKD
ncbi:hypothetical protein THIOSC15_2930017 [uncultured Thiomicrorhabdus sp.]